MIPEADITGDIEAIQSKFEQLVEEAGDQQHRIMMAWQYKAGQMEVLAGSLVPQYNELLGLYNKRSTGFTDCNDKPISNGDTLRGVKGYSVHVEWSEKFGTWEAIEEDGGSGLLSEQNLAIMENVGNIQTAEREPQEYRGYTIAPFHHEYFWCDPQTYTAVFSATNASGNGSSDSGFGTLKECKDQIDEFLEDK